MRGDVGAQWGRLAGCAQLCVIVPAAPCRRVVACAWTPRPGPQAAGADSSARALLRLHPWCNRVCCAALSATLSFATKVACNIILQKSTERANCPMMTQAACGKSARQRVGRTHGRQLRDVRSCCKEVHGARLHRHASHITPPSCGRRSAWRWGSDSSWWTRSAGGRRATRRNTAFPEGGTGRVERCAGGRTAFTHRIGAATGCCVPAGT